MSYSITNKDGKIVIEMSIYDSTKSDSIYTRSVSNVLTVKQARAFARNIYAYCRIAEKEKQK